MCNIQLLSPSLLKLSGSSRTTARQKITRPQRERIHRLVSSSWQAGKSTTKRKKAGCFLGSPFSPISPQGFPLETCAGFPAEPSPRDGWREHGSAEWQLSATATVFRCQSPRQPRWLERGTPSPPTEAPAMSSSCSVCRRDECPLPPRGGLRRLPCAERNPDLTGGSHIVPMTLYRDPTLCRAIFFFCASSLCFVQACSTRISFSHQVGSVFLD